MPMNQISAVQFWAILSDALEASDRRPLSSSKQAPERAIIAIDPSSQVLRILAGPGSGKTEMLVWRVLYDLIMVGTKPERILLTTFTRKAAEELTVRLAQRTEAFITCAAKAGLHIQDPKVHDVRIGTIHSLCDSLLSEFVDAYYQKDFRLLDELEAELHMRKWWWQKISGAKVRDVVTSGILSDPITAALLKPTGYTDGVEVLSASLGHHTETWLPRCHDPADSTGAKDRLNGLERYHTAKGLTQTLRTLQQGWTTYLCDKPLALDFTQIQAQFLENQGAMINHIDHVYVDEFQDTNPIQYAIHLGWLITPGRDPQLPPIRLTVVGDDDQSIYRFRGSDVGCFLSLEHDCKMHKIPFRQELLEVNHRSAQTIVAFSQVYRKSAIPKECSLTKAITHDPLKKGGDSVRLISGPWDDVCALVAQEATAAGYGLGKVPQRPLAVLMFSVSEKNGRRGADPRPAATLRAHLDAAKIGVANPRNRLAGSPGSHTHTLAALLSWFIDPLSRPANPATGKKKRCAASYRDDGMAHLAPTVRPGWVPDEGHLSVQAQCWEVYCGKDNLGPSIRSGDADFDEVLEYLTDLRASLPAAWSRAAAGGKAPRLTLAGLVARLITFPLFRKVGYKLELFRQALFSQLSETAISASRATGFSLDDPIKVTLDPAGKVDWDGRVWEFIGALGQMVKDGGLNDPEIDALQLNALPFLTFHQSKGLEFADVYLAATGRTVDPSPVILTQVFSGKEVKGLGVNANGDIIYADKSIDDWAQADAAREIYVAMTRAKQRLTILHDPNHGNTFMGLDPTIEKLFAKIPKKTAGPLTIQEWTP
jgi:superfamily I DNA/RNA helicase